MTISAETMPTTLGSGPPRRGARALRAAPGLLAAFAVAVVATAVPQSRHFFARIPDSLLRLVQVRDLLAGQGWFDLVQHRLDPPDGVLMHWSRLIDAPIAGLMLLGGLFGDGEAFALTAWPLLMLLGMMAAAMCDGDRARRPRRGAAGAGAGALLLLDPLLSFLPGDIDHHNAQLALMMATLACAHAAARTAAPRPRRRHCFAR